MNSQKLTQNKRYILIAGILFAILIPLSIVIVMTLLGGNPTGTTDTGNTTTNITADGSNSDQQISPSSSLLQIPLSFYKLFPGKANSATVLSTLGNPRRTAHLGDYTTYYYQVQGGSTYNCIIFKNDTVQYIIEQKPNLPSLLTQYKNQTNKHEDGILYDINDDNSGVNLYTFAQNGVAFANDQDTDQTSQVHYFIPESYQTFLLTEGVYISFETPPNN